MKQKVEAKDNNNNKNVNFTHKNNQKRKREGPEENQHLQKNQSSNSNDNQKKTSGKKEVAIFGNYRNYYGYRVGREEDPRLKVLKREWFEGKDCLDIGCNIGVITIAIAQKFGCRSILGVDIDGARIKDAHWTLREVMRRSVHKNTSKVRGSADAELVKNGSENATTESQIITTPRDSSGDSPQLVERDLSTIVSFQKGNFVQNWHPPANAAYDVILCLSVTKWVHLNWGDGGLITLFWRVWKLLHPGGVFILEPQPWSSYHSNRQVSEVASANYKSIEIPPEDFQDVLLDKIGFRRVENLTSSCLSGGGNKSGFNRPLLAFWK